MLNFKTSIYRIILEVLGEVGTHQAQYLLQTLHGLTNQPFAVLCTRSLLGPKQSKCEFGTLVIAKNDRS